MFLTQQVTEVITNVAVYNTSSAALHLFAFFRCFLGLEIVLRRAALAISGNWFSNAEYLSHNL